MKIQNFYRATFLAVMCVISVVILSLSSCRHPDGNIGHLLGNWQIEEIEVDGAPLADYKGNIMISFQGEIFLLAYVEGAETFGTWTNADSIFTLRADYNAGSAKEWPTELGFGTDRILQFDLLEEKSKHMTWRRTNSEGKVYTYYLKKLL